MTKKSTLTIDSTGYIISLLNVAPGEETYVANHLSRAIKKTSKTRTSKNENSPICLLKLFGKYDLCTIYKTQNYFKGPSSLGSIKHIRDGNKILSFRWKVNGQNSFLDKPSTNNNVWGLLFFRINEKLAKHFGALIETTIAKNFGEVLKQINKNDVALEIFSTTGWAEIVFIVKGKSFRSVISALSTISKLEVTVNTDGEQRRDIFSEKTFSIIGIDFDLIRKSHLLPKIFNEKITFGKGIFPNLSITCSSRYMKAVSDYVKTNTNIGSHCSTYGSSDLIFVPIEAPKHSRFSFPSKQTSFVTWGKFILDVYKLRASPELQGKVYSTAINILDKNSDLIEFPKLINNQSNNFVEVKRKHIELFKSWGQDFEYRLTNLYLGIDNLLQDPLIGDCFKDLYKLMNNRLLEILNEKVKDEHYRLMVADIIDAITFGAEERIHGAFLTLEHVEGKFSPTKGGIQRILRAINFISENIFERLNLKYTGFAIAGFHNEGYYAIDQIINIPLNLLFHPEEWWGLFHEIGHAILWHNDLISIPKDKRILKYLKSLDGLAINETYAETLNFLQEIGSDMFGFYFCYEKQLLPYLKNIIVYLGEREIFNPSHTLRLFSIYMGYKYLNVNIRVFDSISESDVTDFYDFLKKHAIKIPQSGQWKDGELLRAFKRFAPFIKIFHDTYVKKIKSFRRIDESVNSALRSILKGQIYHHQIMNPERLIIKFKENENLMKKNFSARIAAILSLWNSAMMLENSRKL